MKEMKTFKEVFIGDKIWYIKPNSFRFLDEKDRYGNVFQNSIVKSITIKSLSEDKKGVLVNVSGSYSDRFDLRVPVSSLHKTEYAKDEKLFFVNETDYIEIVKKHVLAEIQKQQDSIETHANRVGLEIQELRKKYWNYLT